jgi:hypothetical protein
MRRCVFVGPSLHGVARGPDNIDFLPPAARGDIVAAVERGVKWIGLVDGYFGSCASVWHKEILYALSRGCHVWGAASMGALRAAECLSFGMVAVGEIARQFATGELEDDAEVALLHGPPEADFVPFTEPLVDVRATLAEMSNRSRVSVEEAGRMLDIAGSIHFTERTVEAIAAAALGSRGLQDDFRDIYAACRIHAKQADALLLLAGMSSGHPGPVRTFAWNLNRSASLDSLTDGATGIADAPADRASAAQNI